MIRAPGERGKRHSPWRLATVAVEPLPREIDELSEERSAFCTGLHFAYNPDERLGCAHGQEVTS